MYNVLLLILISLCTLWGIDSILDIRLDRAVTCAWAYVWCACARVRVCACARVRVCACARVRVCACARVRVCACARVRLCACARARVCDRLIFFSMQPIKYRR